LFPQVHEVKRLEPVLSKEGRKTRTPSEALSSPKSMPSRGHRMVSFSEDTKTSEPMPPSLGTMKSFHGSHFLGKMTETNDPL
jgi:hypothetical protein